MVAAFRVPIVRLFRLGGTRLYCLPLGFWTVSTHRTGWNHSGSERNWRRKPVAATRRKLLDRWNSQEQNRPRETEPSEDTDDRGETAGRLATLVIFIVDKQKTGRRSNRRGTARSSR